MWGDVKSWGEVIAFSLAFGVLLAFAVLILLDFCKNYCVSYREILDYVILQKGERGEPDLEYCGEIKEKRFLNRFLIGYVIEEDNCFLGSERIVYMEKVDVYEVIEYLARLGRICNIDVEVTYISEAYREMFEKALKEMGIEIKVCEFGGRIGEYITPLFIFVLIFLYRFIKC